MHRTESPCPNCFARVTAEVFPALFRPRASVEPAALALGLGEACCYEHSTRIAAAVCNRCGRFVCSLCEVEMQGQVWCPACLYTSDPKEAVQTLETRRTLYDSIALALATWPLLLFYPAFITAPVSIYVSIRYWKRPSSLIPRRKWRLWLALILAVAEVSFFVAVIVILVGTINQRQAK